MIYKDAKNDLVFLTEFRANVVAFWHTADELNALMESPGRRVRGTSVYSNPEAEARIPSLKAQYEAKRKTIAQTVDRASRIAAQLGVSARVVQYPPGMLAGQVPPVEFDLLQSILHDPTMGQSVSREQQLDAVDRATGVCEERVRIEKARMWSPLYWVKRITIRVLRMPHDLLVAAGFDPEKFEDSLWPQLFSFLFPAGICYLLFSVYKLTTEQVVEVIKALKP